MLTKGTLVTIHTTNGGRCEALLWETFRPTYSAWIIDGYAPAYLPTRRVIDSLRIDRVEVVR